MDTSPVTVIITTYHRPADVLNSALESVLAQTAPPGEILVVDDNENDSPFCAPVRELCARFPAVRYIKADGNTGPGAARNLGAREAAGEFIAFLDDDDLWMPEKLEKQLAVFAAGGSGLGLVYCHGIQRQEDGAEYVYYNFNSDRNPSYPVMLGHDAIGSTSGPMMRKSAFEELGGFWEELPASEDFELWIRFARSGYRIDCADEELFLYRMHTNERVSSKQKNLYRSHRMIYFRYREDLKRYPVSREKRLNRLIGCRTSITPEVLCFGLERLWVRIRYRSVLNAEKKK